MWRAICGDELQLANKALDYMTAARGGTMAARGKLPAAVRRKVATAVKANWPLVFNGLELDQVFGKRAQIGGGDMRAPHLKHFRVIDQFHVGV